MTRNNLDEHLSWLLQTKATIPASNSALPAVSLSFTATLNEPAIPSQDNTEAAASPQSISAPPQTSGLPMQANMARLRTAPASAAKPSLISLGPRMPDAASATSPGTPSARGLVASARSMAQNTFTPTPVRKALGTAKPAHEVDVMDLTESMDRLSSPSKQRGRKRKSSELDGDGGGQPRAANGRGAPNGALPTASQQGFTTIDEIMNEPLDPPPPYSTIASRPTSPQPVAESSSTLGPFQEAEIHNEEQNDDDRLVEFSRKAPRREDSVPAQAPQERAQPTVTPTTAQPNASSTLLGQFLALKEFQISELIEKVKRENESLVEAVFELLEADNEDDALQADLKRSSERCDALNMLSKRREDYRRLMEEKEQTATALKHAIRTQRGLEDAKAANSACKAKLQEVERECMDGFQTCQKDIEAYIESLDRSNTDGGRKRIDVQSTQADMLPQSNAKPSVPSSSRIAQTQMTKPNKTPAKPAAPQQNLADVDSDASNIAAYFSPSRRAAGTSGARDQMQPHFNTSYQRPVIAHYLDEFEDGDFVTGEADLFSNRMGTPPAPYVDQEEDDFGMGDDDGMLELVQDVENRGLINSTAVKSVERPVFTELANNSQRKATNISAKKTKRPPPQADDPNMEELFRFSWSLDVKKTLKERFRLKGFRQNQLQAINATLAGKDTFVLMPTGGGKSLCYQLPALIQSGKTIGVTVVVSPLLSLMEDQVQHLRKLSIQAFVINGETKADERNAIFEALNERKVEDYVQLLYITPEMLAKSPSLMFKLERLYQRQRLARLVIDEAHCVSQWGHDFRPDYKQIGDVRRKFPDVPVMALTATATENVKVDTIHNLNIGGCEVYSQSFNRANLYYEVREKGKGKADIRSIADLINEEHAKQTGIIYCFSKQNCETIARTLREEHQIEAHHYHAALKPGEKSEVQKAWQAGKIHVIVATIAFGMGIDKPNVRFVIHHTIPKSLEGYYQETGRAGRDQKSSRCYLFYSYKDAGKIRSMIADGEGSPEQIQRQQLMFRKMIQYCENRSDCRRVQVLRYFSENFNRKDCNSGCDNCTSTSTFETVDFTSYAQKAVNLVRRIARDKVTLQHCIDIFCEAKTSKITEKSHAEVDEYGAGNDLKREDVERLFSRLVCDEALAEVNQTNKKGFPLQYVGLGRRCNQFDRGNTKLEMEVRTTPRSKPKAAPKKAAPMKANKNGRTTQPGRKMKKAAGLMTEFQYDDDVQYPMSTNVSSPIQAASTRKQAKKPVRNEVHSNGYYRDDFVISDPEDGNYAGADDDSSSDGFEPVRNYNEPQPKKVRTAGPPITSDRVMEDLDETHRDIVGNFVMTAKEISKKIAWDKSLSSVPFTDTMLRAMAINFTETEAQMLQIPGINPERVRLYGKLFYKDIAKCRKFYEEALADRPDPNDRNVIDLVSDDEDEYGSIGSSDLEVEDEEGEPSEYFHPTKAVEDFNARFAHPQSAATRESTATAPNKKAPLKSKKRSYRATASAGSAIGRRNAGGPRQTSNSYDNYNGPFGGGKKSAGNRQTGEGNRGGSFVSRGRRVRSQSRGGGIAAMPT